MLALPVSNRCRPTCLCQSNVLLISLSYSVCIWFRTTVSGALCTYSDVVSFNFVGTDHTWLWNESFGWVSCSLCFAAPLSQVWHRLLQHVLKQALDSAASVTKARPRLSVLLQQVDDSRPADTSRTVWTRCGSMASVAYYTGRYSCCQHSNNQKSLTYFIMTRYFCLFSFTVSALFVQKKLGLVGLWA